VVVREEGVGLDKLLLGAVIKRQIKQLETRVRCLGGTVAYAIFVHGECNDAVHTNSGTTSSLHVTQESGS
jgi:hypothetical protein